MTIAPACPRRGLVSNEGLQGRPRKLIAVPVIEAWPIAFAAVAADLAAGERVILDHGDGPKAVAALACMPVLFEPVEWDAAGWSASTWTASPQRRPAATHAAVGPE